jgi:hypothetical protein
VRTVGRLRIRFGHGILGSAVSDLLLVPGLRAREETRLDRRAKVELFEQIRREYD